MTLPNFLIIGAARSGTTSLYTYLKQHPQVYMSEIKEPEFFSYEGVELDFDGPKGKEKTNRGIRRYTPADIEGYRALFQKVSNEKAIGEASPMYLYSAQAPSRIKHHIPDAKLIAILRNPVERAYSTFSLLTLQGREPLKEFSQALQAEEPRIRNKWTWMYHYKNVGFYYVQLKRYFDVFERDQIRVYLYDDLKVEPIRLVRDVFGFLEVDDTFVPEVSVKDNPAGTPKSEIFSKLVDKPNPVKTLLRPLLPERIRKRIIASLSARNLAERSPLAPEIRSELVEVYREDILKLETLIGRDLSGWLK
jgi:sulfotransferase family protein